MTGCSILCYQDGWRIRLGIGEFTSAADPNALHEIYKVILALAERKENDISEIFQGIDLRPQNYLGDAFRVSILSDTIVFTLESEKILYAPYVLRLIIFLQIFLLSKGLLARGAILYGECYHDSQKNVIYGKGLVEAHNIEKSTKSPRIVVQERLYQTLHAIFNNADELKKKAAEIALVLTGQESDLAIKASLAYLTAPIDVLPNCLLHDEEVICLSCFDNEMIQRYIQALGLGWRQIGEIIISKAEEALRNARKAKLDGNEELYNKYIQHSQKWQYMVRQYDFMAKKQKLL